MASLNEKIACLGTKHDLEEDKARIMDTLTDINLVNFNNVERYNKNGNHEVLQAFLKLVNDNLRFSAKSEVISNLNANINRINGASAAATMVKEMITELRDICTKASDRTITSEQRETLAFEFRGMLRQVFQVQNDCKFNGMKSLPVLPSSASVTVMPSSGAAMGDLVDTGTQVNATAGTWSEYALKAAGGASGPTGDYTKFKQDVLAETQKGIWKAQIGFDTASILNYELYFWGAKFIMENSHSKPPPNPNPGNIAHVYNQSLRWVDGLHKTAGDNNPATYGDHKTAENCVDKLQTEEATMEAKISGYDAVHDYLARQVEVCELECEAALFSIESQRSEAKNALEEELQNLIRQQEYLNAVCAYRPM